jgi:hypothetical protein
LDTDPGAIWSYFIGCGRVNYTLYLNSGLSQPRCSSGVRDGRESARVHEAVLLRYR